MTEFTAYSPSQEELNVIYARAHRLRREAMAEGFRSAVAFFKGLFAQGAANPAR